MKIMWVLPLTLILLGKLSAQNINFEHIPAQEGLSLVSFTCIKQDQAADLPLHLTHYYG
jgi:hypothetical protein